MSTFLRFLGIGLVFVGASIGWAILGGVTASRSSDQSAVLDDEVGSLWGAPQTQSPPGLVLRWQTTRYEDETRLVDQKPVTTKVLVTDEHTRELALVSSDIDVSLHSDLRRKGLLWYSLYGVEFQGVYRYVHEEAQAGTLDVVFRFPDRAADYDAFSFVVNGKEYAGAVTPTDGAVTVSLPLAHGDEVQIALRYESRGRDQWSYAPANGVGVLRNFNLALSTDFADFDFPASGMSPTERTRTASGYDFRWQFSHLVTAKQIGLVTPTRVQPGELAASLAFSAPVSLLFFFLVVFVLATLRRIDIHPVNYLFIAGAFFAFHLLFAYTADRLPIEAAFALASAVSVFLVVSYLRLVVSNGFAFREAALAQLVYLVGFSLAHFWDGFTGLTVTVLAILTLFVLMQLTGRLKWSEVLTVATPAAPQRL